jgi:cytochrome c oxidase subunit 3
MMERPFASSPVYEEIKPTLSMEPKKFGMWLFLVSVVMIFASLTSAYIVRKGDGNWLEFELPPIFWVTSGILLLSSVTMHIAYLSAKKDDLVLMRLFLLITTLLGFVFLVTQYYAWVYLVKINVYFVGNPSGSFVYVLTGLHAAHLISALLYLFVMTWKGFTYKIHSKNLLGIELCATYWHFLDVLWIYLFVFLLLNHGNI